MKQSMNDAEKALSSYERRRLEPDPDPEPSEYCDNCGEGIYEGDRVWEIDGEVYCDKCAEEMYSKVMEE